MLPNKGGELKKLVFLSTYCINTENSVSEYLQEFSKSSVSCKQKGKTYWKSFNLINMCMQGFTPCDKWTYLHIKQTECPFKCSQCSQYYRKWDCHMLNTFISREKQRTQEINTSVKLWLIIWQTWTWRLGWSSVEVLHVFLLLLVALLCYKTVTAGSDASLSCRIQLNHCTSSWRRMMLHVISGLINFYFVTEIENI